MKLLDKVLYIEYRDFIQAGWKEQTVKMANHRNGPRWQMVKNPDDKRMPMVQYDTLVDAHKEKLQKCFGDPYEYVAKKPIRELVQKDFKAEEYYLQYRYDGSKPLPVEHQVKYVMAASWLNLLNKLADDNAYVKKTMGLTMNAFWDSVLQIFTADNIDLPRSTRRLFSKMKEYKKDGYYSLIDWRFGNKLAAKIGKAEAEYDPELAEKQVAIIRKASSLHQNFDAAQITRAVNMIFEKQGWPTISHATVSNIIKEYRHLTIAGAKGKRVYDSTMAMQVKRKAPEFPLLYCTLDGWTVELLYQDENGYNNRLVMVVVLDACCKYPVGYAIGDRESSELIRQANRNAILHLQQLFGNTYRPLQLQSDRYALKTLTPFYQAMAHIHTPAAVGNAKAKIIEPYFRYINKQYFQAFPNWSGHNITSRKENQPNIEYLDKIKKDFPNKAGVIRQIELVMEQERRIKIEQYRQSWDVSPEENKLVMSKIDWLMLFGKPHTHTNKIIGQGIVATLNGAEFTYDSFDPAFRSLQHINWQLWYDQADMRQVLAVSECGKHRFVLEEKRAIPMDIHSTTAEDYAYLKQIRDFQQAQKQEIMETYAKDDAIVQEVLINTPLALDDYNEAALKLMFTHNGQQKEKLQDAKGLKAVKQKQQKQIAKAAAAEETDWNNVQMEYLQSKTDFNKYLD